MLQEALSVLKMTHSVIPESKSSPSVRFSRHEVDSISGEIGMKFIASSGKSFFFSPFCISDISLWFDYDVQGNI